MSLKTQKFSTKWEKMVTSGRKWENIFTFAHRYPSFNVKPAWRIRLQDRCERKIAPACWIEKTVAGDFT